MLNRWFIVLSLFAAFSISSAAISPQMPKTDSDGCYQIGTAAELYGFAAITNGTDGMVRNTAACGKLTANIVVNQNVLVNDTLNGNGSNFTPWTPIEVFSGTLDGQYHTISGLYLSKTESTPEEWTAMILSAKPDKEGDTVFIKNIGIEDSYFFSNTYAAGILASIDTGTVAMTNVYFASFTHGYYNYAGGLVGDVRKGPLYVKNSFTYFSGTNAQQAIMVGGSYSETKDNYINCFGLDTPNLYTGTGETEVAASQFNDGTVALRLHSYPEGYNWGQNVGVDKHPVFSGMVSNYSGTSTVSKLTFHTEFSNDPYPDSYMEGIQTPLPIPSRDEYAFIGWFKNELFSGDTMLTIGYKQTGDLELFARWVPLPKQVDNCYQIGTADELYGFAAIVNGTNGTPQERCACGKLTEDVTVNQNNDYGNSGRKLWFPIMDYCGDFDGNNKTISGLYYYKTDISMVGLFGSTNYKSYTRPNTIKSSIKNLNIKNVYFEGDGCTGILVGDGRYVDIFNIHIEGSVYGKHGVGGFAGCLANSTIDHSFTEAIGSSWGVAGGTAVGSSQNVFISNTYSQGSVSSGCCSSSEDLISMIGSSSNGTLLENCYLMLVDYYQKDSASLGAKAINSFYNGTKANENEYGTYVSTREFNDGTIAKLLREYTSDSVDGSIWGQDVGVDPAPVFKDNFEFSSTVIPKTPEQVDGCYQIGTVEELFGFANTVNSALFNITPYCAKLTNDIVLNNDVIANQFGLIQWIPIREFDGIFDGQGHTISGLYFNDTTVTNAGLFATIKNQDPLSPAVIKNLSITDAYLRGGLNTATLVAKIDTLSKSVLIENVQAEATISNGYTSYSQNEKQFQGGLVGIHVDGKLTLNQSSCESKLVGSGSVGGLVGHTKSTDTLKVFNSYSISNGYLLGSTPSPMYVGTTRVVSKILVENTFHIGRDAQSGEWNSCDLFSVSSGVPFLLKNTFQLKNSEEIYSDTTSPLNYEVTEEQFKNGQVASALHQYRSENIDGSIWGQKVGTDMYPKFSREISGTTAITLSPLHLVTYEGDTANYVDQYTEGIEYTLPVPERKDYIFKGWYLQKDYFGKAQDFIPSDAMGEQTYYAKWWHTPQLTDNCYEIKDMGELHQFAEIYNSDPDPQSTCVKLVADLEENKNVLVEGKLNETDSLYFVPWTPIQNFSGTFDGQGHSISGLFFSNGNASNVGLFGSIGYKNSITNTEIKNLSIKDSYFNASSYIGSLIGSTNPWTNLSVINVSSESVIKGSYNYVGGLIGIFDNEDSESNAIFNLVNVRHQGQVDGRNLVAGIVASVRYAETSFANVSHSGDINGWMGISGLITEIYGGSAKLVYTYNDGNIHANSSAAGLIFYQKNSVEIYNSYNVGNISVDSHLAGGLVCSSYMPLTLVNAYNKGELTSAKDSLVDALIVDSLRYAAFTIDNLYHLDVNTSIHGGTAATLEEFTDLSLFKKLHDYSQGEINGEGWGQEAGDAYPTFKQEIVKDYALSQLTPLPEISSSSSEIESSAEVANESSSSETIESSSSGQPANSVSESSSSMESSSSDNTESSSSETIESSSDGIDVASARKLQSKFKVKVTSQAISIVGASQGATVTILDMQGRILYRGSVTSTDFYVTAPVSGNYILRIQNQAQTIRVP